MDLTHAGPALFFKIGYAAFGMGDYAGAVSYYAKSIESGNRQYEVYYNKAAALELINIPSEALDNYQAAYDRNADYKILYSMGNCAVFMGLYSKALIWYQQFLQREPRNTEALFGLANAQQMKRDYEQAVQTYQQILSIDAHFAKAYFNLGSIYAYHIKNVGLMKEYWGKYIQMFPGNDDVEYVKTEMKKNGG
jgi:tetratricopeptide (TPR) repeat protein